jgi:hypothetical protein
LPWPLCTILGFCLFVSVTTVVLKIFITSYLGIYLLRKENHISI